MDVNLKSSSNIDDNVTKIFSELSKVLETHTGVHEEIFTIVIHLSPTVGFLLPTYKVDTLSSTSTQFIYASIVLDKLKSYYLSRLIEAFPNDPSNDIDHIVSYWKNPNVSTKLLSLCICLEKLQILLGNKQTYEKFHQIVSNHLDYVLHQYALFDENAYININKLTNEFVSLFLFIRVLIDNIGYILTCAHVCSNHRSKLLFIQDAILKNLSLQLLTLADSIKGSFLKVSSRPKQEKIGIIMSNQIIKFSDVASDQLHFSVEALMNFSTIIIQYLSLEDDLKNCHNFTYNEWKTFGFKKGVLKHQSLDLPDLIKTSQHSTLSQTSAQNETWNWCETLQEIAPILSSSMVNCLIETSNLCLNEAKQQSKFSGASMLDIVSSSARTVLKRFMKAPKKCFKFSANLNNLILKCLPISFIGKKHRLLSKLLTDFSNSVNQILKEEKHFIMDLLDDIPEKNCPSVLPTLFATVIDTVLVLEHCEKKLQLDHHLPFSGTLQLYKSLCIHVHQVFIQYHKSQLSTIILHDAESNYWSDPKCFAENKRCSYSVDMWQIYLSSLCQNLFLILDDETAQKIGADIFSCSLCILANRYCNCNPSLKRLNQIKQDVSEILRFCCKFLWKIQATCFDICPSKRAEFGIYTAFDFDPIRWACKDLVICINILGCSFDELSSTVELLESYEQNLVPQCTWMSDFYLRLFPFDSDGKFNTLNNSAYVHCILCQLKKNSDKRIHLTVKALTAKRGLLFNKLCVEGFAEVLGSKTFLQRLLKIKPFCSLLPVDLLINCKGEGRINFKETYTNFNFLSCKSDQCFPWQVILQNEFLPKVIQALKSAVSCMSFYCLSSFSKSLLRRLPAEVTVLVGGLGSDNADKIVHMCSTLVLQELRCLAWSLPDLIISILVKIDEQLHKSCKNITLLFDSYGAHFLLHLVHFILTSSEHLKGFELSPSASVALTEVARFLLDLEKDLSVCTDSDETFKLLSDEIFAFKKCTFTLFSHVENVDLFEYKCDFSLFTCLLEEGSITNEEKSVLMDVGNWIIDNFDFVIQQLDSNFEGIESQESFIEDIFLNLKKPHCLCSCLNTFPRDAIVHLLCQRPEFKKNAVLNEEEKEKLEFIKCYFKIEN